MTNLVESHATNANLHCLSWGQERSFSPSRDRAASPPSPCRKRQVDPRRNRSGSRESHKLYRTSSCASRPSPVPCSWSESRTPAAETSAGKRKRRADEHEQEPPSGREGDTAPAPLAGAPEPALSTPDAPAAETTTDADAHVGPCAIERPPSPLRARVEDYSPPASPRHPSHPLLASTSADKTWEVPCGLNPEAGRTLKIEYWDRTRACKERKWDHMDYIDAKYASREEWIKSSVLAKDDIVLEPNMFPYNTPVGIEHWTLWANRELALGEVEDFVCGWIRTARPEVTRWNLDENAQRSIDIYHVHVYFQVVPDEEVRPPPPDEDARPPSRGGGGGADEQMEEEEGARSEERRRGHDDDGDEEQEPPSKRARPSSA